MRNGKGRIQDVNLVLSGESHLDSSVTKVIPASQSHLLRRRRRWKVRNKDDNGSGYSKTMAQ